MYLYCAGGLDAKRQVLTFVSNVEKGLRDSFKIASALEPFVEYF